MIKQAAELTGSAIQSSWLTRLPLCKLCPCPNFHLLQLSSCLIKSTHALFSIFFYQEWVTVKSRWKQRVKNRRRELSIKTCSVNPALFHFSHVSVQLCLSTEAQWEPPGAWGCSVPRHVRVTPQPRWAVLHLHLRWQTMNESIAVHPNEEGNASTLSGSCVCPSSQSPPCQRRRRGSPALIYITTVAHFNLLCPWSRWGWFLAGKSRLFMHGFKQRKASQCETSLFRSEVKATIMLL